MIPFINTKLKIICYYKIKYFLLKTSNNEKIYKI